MEVRDDVVVADFEAGIGTLTRMGGERIVDIILVVVDPTVKSLEVGARAAALAAEQQLGDVVVVANRVAADADATAVARAFPGFDVVLVPEDPAVADAERRGVAPLDAAPEAPAVRALVGLAERLAQRRTA